MHKHKYQTSHYSCCYFIRLHCIKEQIQAQLMTQDHRALLGFPPATCFLTQNIFSFLLNMPGQQNCWQTALHLVPSTFKYFAVTVTHLHLPNLLWNATLLFCDNHWGIIGHYLHNCSLLEMSDLEVIWLATTYSHSFM